jgi:hypothetical protein
MCNAITLVCAHDQHERCQGVVEDWSGLTRRWTRLSCTCPCHRPKRV